MYSKKYNFCLTVVGARNLEDVSTTGNLDPFVRVSYNNNTYQSMVHKRAGSNPKWDYEIYLCGDEDKVTIEVCDYGLLRTKSIGTYKLDISKTTHLIQKPVPLSRGENNKFCGEIIVNLRVYKNNPAAPKQPAIGNKPMYGSSNGSLAMNGHQYPTLQYGHNSPPPSLTSSIPSVNFPNATVQHAIPSPRYFLSIQTPSQISLPFTPVRQTAIGNTPYPNGQLTNFSKLLAISPVPYVVENRQMDPTLHDQVKDNREQENTHERKECVCITQSCSAANSEYVDNHRSIRRSPSANALQALRDSSTPRTPRSDYYQENYQSRNIPPSYGKNMYNKQPVKNNSLYVCSRNT